MNIDTLNEILAEAQQAGADAAAEAYEQNGNTDWDACGFAWVNIYKHNSKRIDGRSKIARVLKQAGVRQDYTRTFQIWNAGGYGGQSISIKEAAASAYAAVLKQHGFEAYAGSRLD